MAAYCPKCNYKLRLRDWRPECPKCGVNVVYYGIEDRLRAEADVAEYNHAHTQPKIDRIKFSLIGHPLCIVRLVLGFLPILALMLPMGTVHYVLPYSAPVKTVNLISIISFIADKGLDFDLLTKAWKSPLIGQGMIYYTVALFGVLVLLLFTLVTFFFLVVSMSPHGHQRNTVFPVIGMVIATVAFVGYILMVRSLSAALPELFSGTVNPLCYIVVMLLFAAQIFVTVLIKKKNIQVKYTDVSELLLPYNERPSTIARLKAEAGEEAPAVAPAQ